MMRHALACIAVAALLAGCEVIGIGGGGALCWVSPEPLDSMDAGASVHLEAHLFPMCHALGVSVQGFGDAAPMTCLYYSFDFGALDWADRNLPYYPRIEVQSHYVLAPVVGAWIWAESDEDAGAMAGLRLGYGWSTVLVEYRWLVCGKIHEGEPAALHSLVVGVGW
jgi:hypothetical protein